MRSMQREKSIVLSDQQLTGVITGEAPFVTTSARGGIVKDQIQPSSLDLTLGSHIYGMGRAQLPRHGERVCELLQAPQYSFILEDGQDGFLHRAYTYVVPLNEQLVFPQGFSAKFSPKSSTGRADVFVRVLADGVSRFDHVPDGYQGQLYLEITPLSFPIIIRPGISLVQMRIRTGDARLSGSEVAMIHAQDGIFLNKTGGVIPAHDLKQAEHGIYMHVDLTRDPVGFVSRKNVSNPLSFCKKEAHDPLEYYEPIARRDKALTIDPDRFYLLPSKEPVRIPSTLCGDIAPYDASTGEFRTHYAGFFDPGFGGREGITCVLEVRGREVPHRLMDGDPICLMTFEQVGQVARPYNGHYQNAGPSLSKHFQNRYAIWGAS